MKIVTLLLTLFASLSAFLPAAQAFESDSNTVGYTDYGGASYFRDYCDGFHGPWRNRLVGISARTSGGRLVGYSGECQGPFTPGRGSSSYSSSVLVECANLSTYAVDGLRGYSDSSGVTSIGIACNNGSSSANVGPLVGSLGPYYNSVRCPSGNVAWGVWSSATSSRVGRLGMICNNWWP